MIDFEALFKISYGLYIVSAGDDKVQNGFISNTVFQVTAEPAQFATCCNKDNYTAKLIKHYGSYSVSVLDQDADSKLIGRFGYKSGKDTNKFNGTKFIQGTTGAPIVLDDTIAWMEIRVTETIDVGTHLMFIGELIATENIDPEAQPLTYAHYRNVKKGVAPKNAPTYIDKDKLAQSEKQESAGGDKYKCPACGYIYDPAKGDPDNGVPAGTIFDDIPDDWVCPLCGSPKSDFYKIDN